MSAVSRLAIAPNLGTLLGPGFINALLVLLAVACAHDSAAAQFDVRQWHRYELVFADASETYAESDVDPNPFLDRRLICDFSTPSGSATYRVHGFFDADGAGASSGKKFVCRFSPDQQGTWTYVASFRAGQDVAIDADEAAGTEHALIESKVGTFVVGPSDKPRPDFRATGLGWIRAENDHTLKHAGSEKRFIKIGVDVGEGFLGYAGFDNTERECPLDPTKPSEIKRYEAHLSDWRPQDPDWSCSDGCLHTNPANAGREIIGAINYMADLGANSKYMLLLNVRGGDTCDTYPFLDHSMTGEAVKHFDTSKLTQWNRVFEHMTSRGMMLHAQLGEIEIDRALDGNEVSCSGPAGSCIGPNRRLYYREMVARFAHNPAITWNIGEENGYSDDARRDFIAYLHFLDPYDHPVASHTKNRNDSSDTFISDHYLPLLGNDDFDATSIQLTPFGNKWSTIRDEVLLWREASATAGVAWVVSVDEVPSADYNDAAHLARARKRHQWQALMAGGHFEWYLTLNDTIAPHTPIWSSNGLDPWIDDYRLIEDPLRWMGVAVSIFDRIPFIEAMVPVATNTVINSSGSVDTWALADPGVAYLAYDRKGGTFSFDGAPGTYTVTFFDPDSGAECPGSPVTVSGVGPQQLGACACCSTDAAVLVMLDGLATTTLTAPTTTLTTTTTLPVPTTTSTTTTTTLTVPTTTSTTTTLAAIAPSACPQQPLSGCQPADSSRLRLRTSSDAARNRLSWKWSDRATAVPTVFGDPTTATTYTLCTYENGTGAVAVSAAMTLTPSSRWRATAAGYRYGDGKHAVAGIGRAKLKMGGAGHTKIRLTAKGTRLPRLELPLTVPVTVQLLNDAPGYCWTSAFTYAKDARPGRFDARQR